MSNSLAKMIATGQVNIDVVCGEELLHHTSCVRSGNVLLNQESRLVLPER